MASVHSEDRRATSTVDTAVSNFVLPVSEGAPNWLSDSVLPRCLRSTIHVEKRTNGLKFDSW